MKELDKLANNEEKAALLKEVIIYYIKSSVNDIDLIKNYKSGLEEGIIVENGLCANLRSLTKAYNRSYSVHNKVIQNYKCNQCRYSAPTPDTLQRHIMKKHGWNMLLKYLSKKIPGLMS